MANVPLIPFKRPEPQVFTKREEAKRQELLKAAQAAAKPPPKKKKKGKSMSAKKKAKQAPVFTYQNTENMDDKPEIVQFAWAFLSAMDPEGELFVNDKALVIHQGDYADEKAAAKKGEGTDPDTRRPKALGFDEDQQAIVERYAVPDAREEDDEGNIVESSIVGVVFTPYQLIEAVAAMAYAQGRKDEKGKVTSVLTEAADSVDGDEDDDWDPDDDEDEPFDDEEDDDMDVLDEDEEYDEEDDEDD